MAGMMFRPPETPDFMGFAKNAMLDFTPVERAIGNYQQQQQRNVENKRADEQMGMQREKFGLEKSRMAKADEAAEATRIGGIARVIDGEQDPTRRAMMIQNLYKSSPAMAATLQKYGVDPNDHANVPKFLMAQAGNYDPLSEAAKRAQIEASRASANLARVNAANAGQSNIGRMLREAGIDPSSEQGRQIIQNSIKGGSPIDQAIAARIQGLNAPPTMPPPAGFQRQSMEGTPEGQPGIVLAQTASGAPPAAAAQPKPSEPMVDTPLGTMPQSQARTLGFALAYQGKGEAGKMMMGEADPNRLGKEAGNDIDKKIFDGVNILARMDGISKSFKPEYQTIGTRLGMTGAGWMAMIDPSKVDPASAKQLGEFSVFRKRAIENLNITIKEITGAAMSIPEAERIRAQVPDPGQPGLFGIASGDDPITFKAKMDDVMKQTRLAVARNAWLKKNNPQLLAQLTTRGLQGIEDVMPLDRMGGVMNERRDQIYQQLKQRSPNATREQLLPFVGQTLKQEFGI